MTGTYPRFCTGGIYVVTDSIDIRGWALFFRRTWRKGRLRRDWQGCVLSIFAEIFCRRMEDGFFANPRLFSKHLSVKMGNPALAIGNTGCFAFVL